MSGLTVRLSDLGRRRAVLIAIAIAAAALFALTDRAQIMLVPVSPVQAIVLIAAGVVCAIGAASRRGILVVVIGGLMVLLGLVGFVSYAAAAPLIPGGVGTDAVLVALGGAAIAIVLTDSAPAERRSD